MERTGFHFLSWECTEAAVALMVALLNTIIPMQRTQTHHCPPVPPPRRAFCGLKHLNDFAVMLVIAITATEMPYQIPNAVLFIP